MRTLLTVGLIAACGGAACGGGSSTPDAATSDAAPIDVPPDADTGIGGTWIDTYFTTAGTVTQSVCGTAPIAVVVDPMTAATDVYPGACKPDGAFRIEAPPAVTTYYLRAAGNMFETSAHAGLDLSVDRLGRPDVAGIAGAKLGLNLTGMVPWAAGDVLMAFAPNIGFFQSLSFTSGAPQAGATVLTATAPWFGYRVEAAKSDTLQLVQLAAHQTTGGIAYLTLDRSYDAPSFTMANNATADLPSSGQGTFVAPGAGSLTLAIDAASFHAFAATAGPSTSAAAIGATAYAAAAPGVIPSPSLFSFSIDSSGQSILDLGTIGYGDPFPAAWQRLVKVQETFSVPYTWNSIPGSLSAQITQLASHDAAETGTIAAVLGPPTAPKLDGDDAFTAQNITQVPVVSWSAPTTGTPTDYELTIYEVAANGGALTFAQVVRFVTKGTSLRVPEGYLLGQRQYVFQIRARIRTGFDAATTPLRYGLPSASADVLTALVTTSS